MKIPYWYQRSEENSHTILSRQEGKSNFKDCSYSQDIQKSISECMSNCEVNELQQQKTRRVGPTLVSCELSSEDTTRNRVTKIGLMSLNFQLVVRCTERWVWGVSLDLFSISNFMLSSVMECLISRHGHNTQTHGLGICKITVDYFCFWTKSSYNVATEKNNRNIPTNICHMDPPNIVIQCRKGKFFLLLLLLLLQNNCCLILLKSQRFNF